MPAVQVPIVSGSPNTATCSVADGQNYFTISCTAAFTLHFSFGSDSPRATTATVSFIQDGTGRTVTAGSEILVLGTITSTANKITVSRFFYDEVAQGWFHVGQSSTT